MKALQKIYVLFVCVHNAGRSQMAEAFFNLLSHGRYFAISAGTEPSTELNPVVVRAMAELGIDMEGRRPRMLTSEIADRAVRIISMGCGVLPSCPAKTVSTEDWELADPANMSESQVRKLRDEIKKRVSKLIAQLDRGSTTNNPGADDNSRTG